jgi:hypothetical protein
MYGAGGSFKLSGNVALRGERERYDVDGNDVDMVSVGIELFDRIKLIDSGHRR